MRVLVSMMILVSVPLGAHASFLDASRCPQEITIELGDFQIPAVHRTPAGIAALARGFQNQISEDYVKQIVETVVGTHATLMRMERSTTELPGTCSYRNGNDENLILTQAPKQIPRFTLRAFTVNPPKGDGSTDYGALLLLGGQVRLMTPEKIEIVPETAWPMQMLYVTSHVWDGGTDNAESFMDLGAAKLLQIRAR